MAYAVWLIRWRQAHWSNKLLVGLLALLIIIFCAAAIWISLKPQIPSAIQILPQYASRDTGNTRFPINLPEPAAGQSTIKVPLQLPERAPQPVAEPLPSQPSSSQPIQQAALTPQIPPTAEPRAYAPRKLLDALTNSDTGLPIIAADGTTAFDAYRVKSGPPETDERARIALVIVGVGLNSARSEAIFEQMPSEISVAISPYGQTPQDWADKALRQNRDVLVMVPMEPNSYPSVDPGPDTLLRDSPTIQTLQKFHNVLSKMRGYIGIINDTGSRFTANEIALAPVLDDVRARGLMVVDARASAYSVLASEAKDRSIPVAVNTRYVDSALTPNDIDRQLRDLERTAQTLGAAVGVLRDFPVTLERVNIWQKNLDAEEFVLVPISAVANRQPIR